MVYYRVLHESLYGIKNLATRLTTELVGHIKVSSLSSGFYAILQMSSIYSYILALANFRPSSWSVIVVYLFAEQKSLPQLKASVREKQDKTRVDLLQLGEGLPETDEEKVFRLTQVDCDKYNYMDKDMCYRSLTYHVNRSRGPNR